MSAWLNDINMHLSVEHISVDIGVSGSIYFGGTDLPNQ